MVFKTKQKAFKYLIDSGFTPRSGFEWTHPDGRIARIRKAGMSHIVEMK